MVDYGSSPYTTCAETHSTLRIFSDKLSPPQITAALQVEPTSSFHQGDLHAQGKLRRKTNGWFYSTEAMCDSNDGRHHLDLILSAFEEKARAFDKLRQRGGAIDIVSYWVSTGQGGPVLMPRHLLELGQLGVEVWWDMYFQAGDDA